MQCLQCKERKSTYEVLADSEKLNWCDHCFYVQKYKNPKREVVVNNHLVTKEGVNGRLEVIKRVLVKDIKTFVNKKSAGSMLEKKGEQLINHVCEEHHDLADYLKENNISYYELVTSLKFITGWNGTHY